jgi:hypothetical protein
MTPEEPRLRGGWILATALLGAALIATAFRVPDGAGWQDVLASVLVNLGTAVFLVGFFFVLERRFTRVVATERARVEAHVDRQVQALTEPLTTRLDDLEQRMTARVAERTAEQNEAIEAVTANISFDSIVEAFAAVNRINAISNGVLTVEASPHSDGLRAKFSCGAYIGDYLPDDAGRGELVVDVECQLPARENSPGIPIARVIWHQGDAADAVGARLLEAIQRAGGWQGSHTFDWPTALRNLIRGLDIALRSRRRDSGAWLLQDTVYEFVGTEWALTYQGIESRTGGLVMKEEDFPARRQNPRDNFDIAGRPLPPWQPPAPPETIAATDWALLMERGKQYYPRSPMAGFYANNQWMAYTGNEPG